jgi:hypothetical protein
MLTALEATHSTVVASAPIAGCEVVCRAARGDAMRQQLANISLLHTEELVV